MRTLLTALALLFFATEALAVCNIPRPVRPGPPTGPGSGTPGPGTPGTGEPGTGTPGPGGGSGTRRPGRGMNYGRAWSYWWELNRADLLGLRKTVHRSDAVTEGGGDLMGAYREAVCKSLLKIVKNGSPDNLRSAALRALGRAGGDREAKLLIKIIRSANLSQETYEGAAIGLASLQRIEDEELRQAVRNLLDDLLADRLKISTRAQHVLLMSLGVRGRDDPTIVHTLARKCATNTWIGNDAAALLFACGLTRDPMLGSELSEALRTGRMGKGELHDVARAHAALALSMSSDPEALRTLVEILSAPKVREETRRTAAISLGRLLRLEGTEVPPDLEMALERTLKNEKDALTRGYLAVALGGARKPLGMDAIAQCLVKTGDRVEKPFAALALGLAAPRMEAEAGAKVQKLLIGHLVRNRDMELAGALSIAVGLSGAEKAGLVLLSRARDRRLMAGVRGPAIQALGLVGEWTPEVEKVVMDAIEDRSDSIVMDAALALGLLGRRSTAELLVEKLRKTKWEPVQRHMVAALSHLGSTAAIGPLIETVETASLKHTIRESAASAMGILVDPRERDPLFTIDASVNVYGLTEATRELVRIW